MMLMMLGTQKCCVCCFFVTIMCILVQVLVIVVEVVVWKRGLVLWAWQDTPVRCASRGLLLCAPGVNSCGDAVAARCFTRSTHAYDRLPCIVACKTFSVRVSTDGMCVPATGTFHSCADSSPSLPFEWLRFRLCLRSQWPRRLHQLVPACSRFSRWPTAHNNFAGAISSLLKAQQLREPQCSALD